MRAPVPSSSWWNLTSFGDVAENSFTGTLTSPKLIAPVQIERGNLPTSRQHDRSGRNAVEIMMPVLERSCPRRGFPCAPGGFRGPDGGVYELLTIAKTVPPRGPSKRGGCPNPLGSRLVRDGRGGCSHPSRSPHHPAGS